ncbi:MAG: Shedu anti-phage system protein SduA domain-containing protein [Polyangiaceae bacterium]
MDVDLENHVARKLLHALLAFSREFGSLDTVVGPDEFGLTAAQFAVVADRLALAGLVTRPEEEECVVTSDGLVVAMDSKKLDELFPVQGDPDAPLPSELALFGRRAFEAAENPPPPMEWDEYESHLAHVWPRLLNSESQDDEAVFQRFLEKHPCLLPQSFDCFGRGATPERHVYFTQPELPGFRSKRPDFMTITWDSDAVIATLIEIEAPAKPWATQKGFQSAKLTQALDQLREWKAWFCEPENMIQFTKLYRIDQRTLETHQFMASRPCAAVAAFSNGTS